MRWPFGRSSTAQDGSPAPTRDAGAAPAIVRPHDAWRSLPALQRALGAPPTVAPARPFADSLATRRAPALALEPLGHEISPLASPGLVAGLAAPIGGVYSGRPDLPMQRQAGDGPAGQPEAAGWSSFEAAVSTSTGVAAPATHPAASADQQMRPVVIQRLAASQPLLTASAPTTVAPAPAGTLDLRPAVPATAGLPRIPVVPQSRVSAAVPAPPLPAPATSGPPVGRPTLGQARRLGLGAPLGPIHGLAVQREAAPASGGAGRAEPSVARPGRAGAPAGSPPDRLMVSPRPGLDPLPGGAPGPADAAAGVDQRAIEPGLLPVVRPISIQRLAASDPLESFAARAGDPGGERGAQLLLVLGAPGSSTSIQDPEPAGAWSGLAPGRPYDVPDGESSAPLSPLGGGRIRVSSPGSLLLPPDRGAGRDPDRTGQAGQPSPAEPVIARSVADAGRSAAPAAVPGSRTPSGFEGTRRSEQAGPMLLRAVARTGAPAIEADRQADAQPAVAPQAVQRAIQINELDFRPVATDPAPGNAASNGQGAGQGGQPTAGAAGPPVDRDRELDDLARRLYGRIRSRLSAELLADRERAGMITDLR